MQIEKGKFCIVPYLHYMLMCMSRALGLPIRFDILYKVQCSFLECVFFRANSGDIKIVDLLTPSDSVLWDGVSETHLVTLVFGHTTHVDANCTCCYLLTNVMVMEQHSKIKV